MTKPKQSEGRYRARTYCPNSHYPPYVYGTLESVLARCNPLGTTVDYQQGRHWSFGRHGLAIGGILYRDENLQLAWRVHTGNRRWLHDLTNPHLREKAMKNIPHFLEDTNIDQLLRDLDTIKSLIEQAALKKAISDGQASDKRAEKSREENETRQAAMNASTEPFNMVVLTYKEVENVVIKKLGKKIKIAGGSFKPAQYCSTDSRVVHIPVSRPELIEAVAKLAEITEAEAFCWNRRGYILFGGPVSKVIIKNPGSGNVIDLLRAEMNNVISNSRRLIKYEPGFVVTQTTESDEKASCWIIEEVEILSHETTDKKRITRYLSDSGGDWSIHWKGSEFCYLSLGAAKQFVVESCSGRIKNLEDKIAQYLATIKDMST